MTQSDWFTDTGASAHMTPDPSQLDKVEPYHGKDCVVVGNGASLPITHTGTLSPSPNFQLLDVLVVPRPTKNLLSISKLTSDFPFSVTFSHDNFVVQNRVTGMAVAKGKREGGLYVLERGNSAFVSVLKNKNLHASFELWHARLGHVPSPPCHFCADDPVVEPLQVSSSTESTSPSPVLCLHTHATDQDPPAASMEPIHATTSSAPFASHPMITRAKSGIFKPRHPAHLSFFPFPLSSSHLPITSPLSHSTIQSQSQQHNSPIAALPQSPLPTAFDSTDCTNLSSAAPPKHLASTDPTISSTIDLVPRIPSNSTNSLPILTYQSPDSIHLTVDLPFDN
ncbi:hypothetical protein Pint_12201 [Pistacia integerrima]|uniref:Uncharacterized protein n=1 Tax=Pistacia integerrima TaxID=434235 RepID=A0ACC0XIS7_9ROSI|nr:hypothetical protein Pint_12201 [Pistacia integerrima]